MEELRRLTPKPQSQASSRQPSTTLPAGQGPLASSPMQHCLAQPDVPCCARILHLLILLTELANMWERLDSSSSTNSPGTHKGLLRLVSVHTATSETLYE